MASSDRDGVIELLDGVAIVIAREADATDDDIVREALVILVADVFDAVERLRS